MSSREFFSRRLSLLSPASSSIPQALPRSRASASSASCSRRPVPLREGFARIAAHLAAIGRPLAAFCACELRSPEPMSEAAFTRLQSALRVGAVGVGDRPGWPATRWRGAMSAPSSRRRRSPAFHAFSFTVPTDGARAVLRHFGERRGARGQGQLPRPHRPPGRHEPCRAPRQGELRPRRDGAAAGGARLRLGGRHGDAGLHRARHPPVPRRRDRPARRGAARRLPGTIAGRRWPASTTRWTAAV